MSSANLYCDDIDIGKYLNGSDCSRCGRSSCAQFVEALRRGSKSPKECIFLGKNEVYAFEIALTCNTLYSEVPLLTHPRPGPVGLVELNEPKADSPVLLSGNNEYTEQVILSVLGTTTASFFVVFMDTAGNTVDMAMVYKTLTPSKVKGILEETRIGERVEQKRIVIPGFAGSLKEDIEIITGWKVIVGPLCAGEIPLFFSRLWAAP